MATTNMKTTKSSSTLVNHLNQQQQGQRQQQQQEEQTTQSLPPTTTTSTTTSTIFTEYQLMKEFVLFQKQEFLHIYISPSYETPFKWFGVMFIHSGLYKGKILRFQIQIDHTYPNCDIPEIIFNPIPYHPFINQNNGKIINLRLIFPKWTSTSNYIYELIKFIKSLFEFNNVEQLKYLLLMNNNTNKILNEHINNINIDELMKKINEKMFSFNEQCIMMKSMDRNFINFSLNNNDQDDDKNNIYLNLSIIEKLKKKLLTEKYSSNINIIDYINNDCNDNQNNCTTPTTTTSNVSITGLSWAKKIIYN